MQSVKNTDHAASAKLVATAASSAAVSAPATAVTPRGLGARLVDDERAPHQVLSVQAGDGLFGRAIIGDFDEAKAARLAGIAVADDRDRIGVDSKISEFRADIFFRNAERKIPHIELFHRCFSL